VKPLARGVPKVLALPQAESSWARHLTPVCLSTSIVNCGWQGRQTKEKNRAVNSSGQGLSPCAEVFAWLRLTEKASLCATSIQWYKVQCSCGDRQRKISAVCLERELNFLLRVP